LEHRKIVDVVYLSGCMEGLTKEEMNEWRDKAEKYFATYEIEVINPVRTPTQLNEKIIVRGDKRSIDVSDCMLVNLEHLDFDRIKDKVISKLRDFRKNGWINANNMSKELIELFNSHHIKAFGTIQEVIYGYEKSKPIVVVINENWEVGRLPIWLAYHVDFVTKDMTEALKYIVSLNNRRIRKVHLPEQSKEQK